MTSRLVVIGPETPMRDARRLMRIRDVLALPVVDARGAPLGIVTSTDLLKNFPIRTPVSRIMTKELIAVPRDAEVARAVGLMRRHRVHHVAVTEAGKVVGMLSTFDFLRLVEDRPPT